MFNVCPQCGEYSDEKAIDVRGPSAICPACGYAHRQYAPTASPQSTQQERAAM